MLLEAERENIVSYHTYCLSRY